MSANSDNLQRSYSEQLSDLDSCLGSTFDDEAVLAEIHVAIKGLLTNNGDSEARIRAILQKRLDAGDLRPESFELVQKMLDRILTEHLSTMPAGVEAAPQNEVPHVATQVIEDNVAAPAPNPTPAPADNIQTTNNQIQVGSVLRDRFLLQQRVLGGSMGTVYKALDRRLAEAGDSNPYVAIKVLSPKLSRNGNALRALQSEAAKGRCLSHPNIVRFIDLDREGELYFIVMEWLEGKSLSTILDDSSSKNIDLNTTLDIVKQVGRALDYAHQRGVIHADIKPGNIMITPSGIVKLFDFGVARVRQKEQEGQPNIDAGELSAKTPAYSSMQVLTGETPVAADDVFSLGCLMYRLVAGYRVFGPRNAAEAAAEGMEPQKPQGLNDGQWQALKKALAYSRVPRFASPAAFVAALDGKSETSVPMPMVADEPLAVDDYDDEPKRSPWRLAVLGAILIGAVVVVMQTDILERLEEFVPAASTSSDTITDISANTTPPVQETAAVAQGADEAPAESDDVAVTGRESEVLVDDVLVEGFIAEESPQETAVDTAPAAEEIVEPEIDFAALLPPTLTVGLAATGQFVSEVDLTLREDGESATIDLVRMNNILESFSVKLEEVGFSGNRSPWEAGQYEIASDGLVTFKAGQSRVRTTISMPSDPLREPDRNVTIQIREVDNAASELAIINLKLEDDDQRVFEAGLPQDTIGFAVSQISVREGDPAAQIDVVRFKPGNTSIEVRYVSRDVTATAEEDYFPPDYSVISFRPGQRSARIFIPLGQDAEVEPDEAFMLELVSNSSQAVPDIYQRIAVMIRDDD